MRTDTDEAAADDGEALYMSAKKIYPQNFHGTFRRIKWIVLFITLGIYYFTPFIRWDRGPNAPDQAVMIDMAGRRAYFFWIEIWPQEVYYLTGLLIMAALVLFLMNAIAGRIWCGYLCPQTVWTDLFLAVERWTEGDRRARIALDKAPWTGEKIARRTAKHFLWLMIAWWTGGAWVLYFGNAPDMIRELATFQAPMMSYIFIGVLTFTTYALAGHMREQVCIYMCPWPRIQAALTDEWALNVTYKHDRGEPRGSLKQNRKLAAEGKPAGDCVDCGQCVVACPTGVDIRDGLQLGCIQCGLCIDACDSVMTKVNKPTGLIGYDTDVNMERREKGLAPLFRFIRPRTLIYAVLIAIVGGAMVFQLSTRELQGVTALHDRNPVFVALSDGGVRNGFTVHIKNKRSMPRRFLLTTDGLPVASRLEVIGSSDVVKDNGVEVFVGPDTVRDLRMLVFADKMANPPEQVPLTIRIVDVETGEEATATDFFRFR
ncbi:cytochrome c oxidase accessory protein CcoG [Segnochrobactraceae bacterium EtOH-i3]